MTTDVGATALGLAAFYAFRRWLLQPDWGSTIVAGVVFGLAQLTKTTWIVLFGVWPLVWMVWAITGRRQQQWGQWRRELLQLATILSIAVWLINSGYGFEGSLQSLGEYQFLSTALNGGDSSGNAGNRFTGTLLGSVPVPLPRNYVQGIDRQKHHFERPNWSYLAGEWRERGWYHYYVYAMLVKVPLGIWLLAFSAVLIAFNRNGYRAARRDEWLLTVPMVVVLVLVSSQTGFNRHLRYVLPVFPFGFILVSRLALAANFRHQAVVAVTSIALGWSVMSSLMVYPHSLSYFNELGGGPRGGHAHLLSSNIDWGQDLLYLKRWSDANPHARPLYVGWQVSVVDPRIAGINFEPMPRTPTAGWHAVSAMQLRSRSQDFQHFLDRESAAMAGYSIYVYHLTEEDCESLRRAIREARDW